jgi:hypothetical protein
LPTDTITGKGTKIEKILERAMALGQKIFCQMKKLLLKEQNYKETLNVPYLLVKKHFAERHTYWKRNRNRKDP